MSYSLPLTAKSCFSTFMPTIECSHRPERQCGIERLGSPRHPKSRLLNSPNTGNGLPPPLHHFAKATKTQVASRLPDGDFHHQNGTPGLAFVMETWPSPALVLGLRRPATASWICGTGWIHVGAGDQLGGIWRQWVEKFQGFERKQRVTGQAGSD